MLLASPHRYWRLALWSLPRAVPVFMLASGVVLLDSVFHFHLSALALPTGILGTAVAFYVGFKNNQAYERFWEARTAWGSIVNTSRTIAVGILDYVQPVEKTDEAFAEVTEIHRKLVFRHLAWVFAVRLQLREEKSFEAVLASLLEEEELSEAVDYPNVATHLLQVQSRAIEELVERGLIRGTARHLDLRNSIRALYDHQGVCERIKNTPLVPHYTAAATLLVWLYIILVPFSFLNVLEDSATRWAVIPIATLIGWVYDTMDRIGRFTENPFDGQSTDVPMLAICRTIEIDLRAMVGDRPPPAVKPRNSVLS